MMNDRFSAELRQHLLATADERPGDGRLEAIVEGVSVTRQTHPLLGHLPWALRPTDFFPSAVVRYGLIAAALIIAIVAAALFAGNAGRRTVFEGTWTSIDPGDGSTQTLVVGGGPDPAVHFEDEFATGLACRDADVKIFTMDGLGTVVDDRLDIVWPDGGGCGPTKIVVGPGSYAYNAARDTMIDRQGLTWARLERGLVPPTSTPTPERTLQSPTADPDCIDFDGGGTYTAPAGSLSLTVRVPRSVGSPWHGHRDRFELMQSWCADERGGPGLTMGAELTRVYTDACAGVSVAVDSAQAAIDAVSAAKGLEILDQTQVTLGGYPSTRFDVAVSDRLDACPGQEIWLSDDLDPFGTGLTFTLYVIDVDGKTLALALYGADWSTAVNSDLDAMLASMRIEPRSHGNPASPSPSPSPPASPLPSPSPPASPLPSPSPSEP